MGRQHDTKPPLEIAHDLGKERVGGGLPFLHSCTIHVLKPHPKCWLVAFEIHQAGWEGAATPLFKVWLSGGKNTVLGRMNTRGDGWGIVAVNASQIVWTQNKCFHRHRPLGQQWVGWGVWPCNPIFKCF